MTNILFKFYKQLIKRFLIHCLLPLSNFIYELFNNNYQIITASVNPINHNWGDDASIQLCKLINPHYKYIVRRYTWNVFKKNDTLCIGSIITWMTSPKSTIWGSGIVYPEQELSSKPQKVLAVRGPLTRHYLINRGIECPEVYGDPALLFPLYYRPHIKKAYRIGVIPHFRDKKLPIIQSIANDKTILIIDVQDVNPWHKFIDAINMCDFIVSSSLHGIIISDAYQIPNSWVEFSEGEQKRFAFHDYFMSVGKNEETPRIIRNKQDILQLVENIKWQKPNINLNNLLISCPFYNK